MKNKVPLVFWAHIILSATFSKRGQVPQERGQVPQDRGQVPQECGQVPQEQRWQLYEELSLVD